MSESNPLIIKSASLAQIARTANIRTLPYMQSQQNPYEGKVQSFTPDKGLYLSPLGTPVMQDITFGAATYIDRITKKPKNTQPITLINILLAASQSKKIVKTEIQGMRGTIKEYIGEDDWQITINGFLLADNGKNPTNEIIALKKALTPDALSPFQIPVICTWLNNLDIFNIVVEDFAMEQDPGGYSKQAFTISAISDQDVIIQVY